jgi:hypothetical protein
MKLLAASILACTVTAGSAIQRDERLDVPITPEQQAICRENGGCFVMTGNAIRELLADACQGAPKAPLRKDL